MSGKGTRPHTHTPATLIRGWLWLKSDKSESTLLSKGIFVTISGRPSSSCHHNMGAGSPEGSHLWGARYWETERKQSLLTSFEPLHVTTFALNPSLVPENGYVPSKSVSFASWHRGKSRSAEGVRETLQRKVRSASPPVCGLCRLPQCRQRPQPPALAGYKASSAPRNCSSGSFCIKHLQDMLALKFRGQQLPSISLQDLFVAEYLWWHTSPRIFWHPKRAHFWQVPKEGP